MNGMPDYLGKPKRKRGRPKKQEQEEQDEQARVKTAKDKFCAEYAESGNITKAAKAAERNRGAYYEWCDKDPAFQQHCEDLRTARGEAILQSVEDEALKGNIQAAVFWLKSWDPERFGDKTKLQFVPDKDVLRLVAEILTKHVNSETLQAIMADLDGEGTS